MSRRLLIALAVVPLLTGSAAAHIVIVRPNGGELYDAGDVVTIEWCIAVAHDLQNWDLRYNPTLPGFDDACENVTGGFEIIELDVPPTCTFATGGICFLGPDPCCMTHEWTVPDGIDSDEVKIKIKMDNAGTDYFDLSDAPFSIRPSTSAAVLSGETDFGLVPAHPNPFEGSTDIRFVLDRDSPAVRIVVYDATGREVRRLVDGPRPTGRHGITWDGLDSRGTPVGSGIYFYRLTDGARSDTRKMTVLR